MTEKVELLAKVINGKLATEVIRSLSTAISNLDGEIIKIVIEKAKKKRSVNQNSYYWGVIIQEVLLMFREAGNDVDAEEVHSYLKEHVGKLTKVVVDPEGNKESVLQSTTRLSTKEFEDYLERIRAWAAGFGIVIPLPKEYK